MKKVELLSSSMVPSFARGLNILLVDHDTASLKHLASLLTQYLFNVTTAEQASIALRMIQENKDRFKIIMANINVSDMNSLSFLRIVRKEEIPVILIGNERNMDVARKALAEGASFFIQEPVSLNDLKDVWQRVYWKKWMNQLLDTREREQEMMNHGGKKGKSITEPKPELISSNNMSYNEELGQEINNNDEISKEKPNRRANWTPELNRKFFAALSALGGKKPRPRYVYEMMNVSDDQLTIRQVSSHLQYYKNRVRRFWENAVIDSPSLSKPLTTGSLQIFEKNELVTCQPSFQINDYANGDKRTAIGADHIVKGEYTPGSLSNVSCAKGQSPMYFSDEYQEVNNMIAIPEPPADSAFPASPVFETPPSLEYADLWKLLEDDEEQVTGLGGELKPGDVDKNYPWLSEDLMKGQCSDGNKEVNNVFAVTEPPADSAFPASSVYQTLPSPEHIDWLRLLDENEEQVSVDILF